MFVIDLDWMESKDEDYFVLTRCPNRNLTCDDKTVPSSGHLHVAIERDHRETKNQICIWKTIFIQKFGEFIKKFLLQIQCEYSPSFQNNTPNIFKVAIQVILDAIRRSLSQGNFVVN